MVLCGCMCVVKKKQVAGKSVLTECPVSCISIRKKVVVHLLLS